MNVRRKGRKIELSGESEQGDDITVSAPSVCLNNFTMADHSKIHASYIAKSKEEIEIEKKAYKKAEEIIEPQQKLIQELFGSSMKMLFRLGKRTYVETYTPDSDGITRVETDLHRVTFNKGGNFLRFMTATDTQEIGVRDVQQDIQSASDDPKNNFKLISAKKMRNY